MYSRILLPVDGSGNSVKAAEQALSFIEDDSEIILLHVVDNVFLSHIPEEDLLNPAVDVVKDTSDEILDNIKERLEALLEENGYRNVTIIPMNVEGNAANTILEVSKNVDAQMIIMASSNETGSSRFLLGSVTNKVLYHTTVPLVIVPMY